MRGIESLILLPKRTQSIVFGPGASGKTTLMDALGVALDRSDEGRQFAGGDGRNGVGPAVCIRTEAGSRWWRTAEIAGRRTETVIDTLRASDREMPVWVRGGTRIKRPRKVPANNGSSQWWQAVEAATKAMGDDTGTFERNRPERWSDSQAASVGLFIGIAETLLGTWPDEPGVLAQPAVAVVDNIDAYLNPKTQRAILGQLAETFPGTQLIATTRSIDILMSIDPARIFALGDSGGTGPKHAR